MRKILSALALASLVGLATPALADYGAPGSMQRALLVADDFGVVGINEVQYYDGRWQIHGRDPQGRGIQIDVDALTGAVVKVYHY